MNVTHGSPKRRKKRRWVLPALLACALPAAYFALTLPMPRPSSWDLVKTGMSRAEANDLLYPPGFTSDKGAYSIYQRIGLRLWWLRVEFEGNQVSRVKVTAEDPHDTLLQEIDYIRAYLPFR